MKSFRYRLYPTKSQQQTLLRWFDLTRMLYNCALEERKYFYKKYKKSLSFEDQCKLLPEVKDLLPEFKNVYAQVLQNTLQKLKKSFDNFFRRVKSGGTSGYPRFKSRKDNQSITFPQLGFKVKDSKKNWTTVCISKIGHIQMRMHRDIEGKIKTCTIKYIKATDEWYVSFACEAPKISLLKTGKEIGIDLGLKQFITTSDNEIINSNKYYKNSLDKLRKISKKFSEDNKENNHIKLAKLHRKLRNQRDDQLHKISKKLVDNYDLICLENLDIQGMITQNAEDNSPSAFNRSIHDVSWYKLSQYISYKAANADKKCILVEATGTTQECSRCGQYVPKDIKERWHYCEHCGLSLGRDHNAAINILERGRSEISRENGKTFSDLVGSQ